MLVWKNPFLDLQGLSNEDNAVSGAALKSMKLFVTTLLEICQAQRRLHTGRLALAVDGVQEGETNGMGGSKTRSPTPTPTQPATNDTATPMVHPFSLQDSDLSKFECTLLAGLKGQKGERFFLSSIVPYTPLRLPTDCMTNLIC